jgi:hypothetical protein
MVSLYGGRSHMGKQRDGVIPMRLHGIPISRALPVYSGKQGPQLYLYTSFNPAHFRQSLSLGQIPFGFIDNAPIAKRKGTVSFARTLPVDNLFITR